MTEEKKDFSESVERINTLFRKFKITSSEKKIFLKLRKTKKKMKLLVNDEEIIGCLIAKKTYEKSLDLMKDFSSVIKEFRIGRVRLKPEHVELMKLGYFWSDPRVQGKNGEVVLFAKASNFNKSPDWAVENFHMIAESHMLFFYRLLFGNPDTLRKGIIIVSDLRGMDYAMAFKKEIWELKRQMAPIRKKIPLRLKKYICLYPPWWMKTLMFLVKKFMKNDKLMKRIGTAKTAEEALEHVTGLPKEMGGKFEFEKMEGLRRIIVQSEEDKEVFDRICGKSKETEKDNEEEGEKEEEES